MKHLLGAATSAAVQLAVPPAARAEPRKVIVLPLDGNAEPAVRARVNATVQRLARRLDGMVTIGDTTFVEAAAAIGCNPQASGCPESVRETLGVDELVFGSVVTRGDETTMIVRRVQAKQPPRQARATIAAGAPAAGAEPALAPFFGGGDRDTTTGHPEPDRRGRTERHRTARDRAERERDRRDRGSAHADAPSLGRTDADADADRPVAIRTDGGRTAGGRAEHGPTDAGSADAGSTDAPDLVVDAAQPPPNQVDPMGAPAPPDDRRRRNLGIVCATGGGVGLVIGLVLWANKASIQGDIDAAPTRTAADFEALEALERRAIGYAVAGNLLVLGGLAVGGYGGWVLYQDHEERRGLVVAPQVTPAGAGVSIGGNW